MGAGSEPMDGPSQDEDQPARRIPELPRDPEVLRLIEQVYGDQRHPLIDHVLAMDDPAERARAAHGFLTGLAAYQDWWSEVRADAIEELRAAGHSYDEIGQMLGLTKSRIQQITWARNRRVHALDELGAATMDRVSVDPPSPDSGTSQ